MLTHTALFNWYEVSYGFKGVARDVKKFFKKSVEDDDRDEMELDIHTRLMRKYPEVPEWWYMILLVVAVAIGFVGVSAWETHTTPAVVVFGYAIGFVFMIPVGIVQAITGTSVGLNVLSELIGGAAAPGNPLAMNFFKSFGVDILDQALAFLNDLKMAHYVKINQRHTFWVQVWATFISTFVFTGMLNFVMNDIPGFCTDDAKWNLTCPDINTFFTAAILWGLVGARRLFSSNGGLYTWWVAGFPIGVAIPVLLWLALKKWPRNTFLRHFHPVVFCSGAASLSPYSLSFGIMALPLSAISWFWLKKRYLEFWSRYNYIISAALGGAIAISGFIQFWCVEYTNVDLEWWGNTVVYDGCEGEACPRLTAADFPDGKPYFGPDPGTFLV